MSIAPGLRVAPPAADRLRVAVPPQRARRDQPLRGRRLRPQQRRRRLPQPDVPLPADRDPLRRHPRPPRGHGYQVHIGPMYSDARGWVGSGRPTRSSTRRCCSTTCPPTTTAASGSRRSRSPATSSTSRRSRRSTTASSRPGRVETDEQILDWVARDAETALHPSCTAKMGVDDMAVPDPTTMKVHGLEGLRVVDAVVLPYVTNGNIYAPVMMLAEKAADLIVATRRCRRGCAVLPATAKARRSTRQATAATSRTLRHDARPARPDRRSTGARSAAGPRGDLWKVFGPRRDKIIGTADADLSRAELLKKTGCVAASRTSRSTSRRARSSS